MKLQHRLQRVEVAGDLLEKAPIHKTKKAAKVLGDETKLLFAELIAEIEFLSGKVEKLEGVKS